MSEINGINPVQNYNIDFSALLSNSSEDKNEDFAGILSSLIAPPPPPPPPGQNKGPMDLEKLDKLAQAISSSSSISDSEKEEILAVIEEMTEYINDNNVESILASFQPRKELTDEQKKVLDTLRTYQEKLSELLREVFENKNSVSVGGVEESSETSTEDMTS